MIAKGKTERRRGRVLRIDGGEIGLIILLELVFVRNVTTVAIHFPTFWKRTQRNTGIVLDNYTTILQEKIPHTGESITVHQERSGLE